MTSTSARLEVLEISSGYAGRRVVENVSLSLDRSESVCLVGPNGAGKSTLLRTIAGLIDTQSGEIRLNGTRIERLEPFERSKLGIATALQGHRVFNGLTVRENLAVASRALGPRADFESVRSVFPSLAGRWNDLAGELSGGSKQLLAIACCLVASPRIVLLDEPTLGLPDRAASSVFDHLRHVQERQSLSLVLVEHRIRSAIELCDRVVGMKEGRIVLDCPAEEILADSDNTAMRELYGVAG